MTRGKKVESQEMGSRTRTNPRMSWQDLCARPDCRGRWVALDNVRYDPTSSKPVEGDFVDADDDLAELCARMLSADRTACAIVHCIDQAAVLSPALRHKSSLRATT